MPVTDGLISGTHTIQSPEIERVPSEIAYTTTDHDAAHAYVGYQTVGVAKSELRIPVTADKIRQLANARYIEVSLHVTSTTKGADGTRPFVIVRNTDRLKLKMFVVAGAHMRINDPLDINRNK